MLCEIRDKTKMFPHYNKDMTKKSQTIQLRKVWLLAYNKRYYFNQSMSDLHYTRIYDVHRLKQNESN